jgi:hypothetical protein
MMKTIRVVLNGTLALKGWFSWVHVPIHWTVDVPVGSATGEPIHWTVKGVAEITGSVIATESE